MSHFAICHKNTGKIDTILIAEDLDSLDLNVPTEHIAIMCDCNVDDATHRFDFETMSFVRIPRPPGEIDPLSDNPFGDS